MFLNTARERPGAWMVAGRRLFGSTSPRALKELGFVWGWRVRRSEGFSEIAVSEPVRPLHFYCWRDATAFPPGRPILSPIHLPRERPLSKLPAFHRRIRRPLKSRLVTASTLSRPD